VHQLAVDENFVIRAAGDFEWVDEMVYNRAKEVTTAEGKADGIPWYTFGITRNHGTTVDWRRKCSYEGSNKKSKSTSDGDPDHHNRDPTTTKTQEQGRQEREEITKPIPHTTEWIQQWLTLITPRV
jgi:hypothetical protein